MQSAAVIEKTNAHSSARASIRQPRRDDGAAVWRLVSETTALDDNSMYCNLLQCSHFAATCALAEMDGEVVGWASGYIPPEHPGTYFVWQVCVSEKARGQGLAKRLIKAVLARPVCDEVTKVQSTITANNKASWALFGSIASTLDTDLKRKPHFERDNHFDGLHDTEFLVTIGPFDRQDAPLAQSSAA